MSEAKRAKPLAKVVAIYERDDSQYPETVRIAMDDGLVIDYRIDIPQPGFQKAMGLLDKLPIYGGYKAPKMKKRWRR